MYNNLKGEEKFMLIPGKSINAFAKEGYANKGRSSEADLSIDQIK